jgi:hypothetical protein
LPPKLPPDRVVFATIGKDGRVAVAIKTPTKSHVSGRKRVVGYHPIRFTKPLLYR